MTLRSVAIHYRRLPDRVQVFEQPVLDETEEYVVTFAEAAPVSGPVVAAGRTILEPGSPVVWFTYPGRGYDLGRFHRVDGTFTGIYANILTPVVMTGDRWDTTDLCLDVWVGADGAVEILDEDDLAAALEAGWLDDGAARSARDQAEALAAAARTGSWPPGHVSEWELPRARARLRELRAKGEGRA